MCYADIKFNLQNPDLLPLQKQKFSLGKQGGNFSLLTLWPLV